MKLHFTATSALTVWPVGRAGGSPEGRRASGQEGAEAARPATHGAGERRPSRLTVRDFVAQQLLASNSSSHL